MAYIHPVYDPYYYHHHHHHQQEVAAVDEKGNAISTLFVSGLPDDVKAREIHNLFRRRPGFDYCQLKYTGRGNQVVAFATFFNHQSAMAALHSLNGVKFDPQTGATLHIELARSNSRRVRLPGSGPYIVIDNRNKKSSKSQAAPSSEGDSDSNESNETGDAESADQGESADTVSEAAVDPDDTEAAGDPDNTEAADDPDNTEAAGDELPAQKRPKKNAEEDVTPCSTLFIANLGPNCTENELKEALSRFPGFNVLKWRPRGGMPVAFADFEEVEQASKAMEDLQGSELPSSDRGGLHIEYARSKMRKH